MKYRRSGVEPKVCIQCGTSFVKPYKASYKQWDKRQFCTFKCHGRYQWPVVNTEESFWQKVDKSGDCWIWQGSLKRGYGQYSIWGRSWGAHQVSYQILKGKVPDGMTIDHLCRVKTCVNPDHFEIVTGGENTRRANEARRRERAEAIK